MRASIIYGTYVILNVIALFLIDHWLCSGGKKYRDSIALRVIVNFLYITMAFIPVLAMMIRENIYQYFLLRFSYIWMGFLMYFGGLLLIASIVKLILHLISKSRAKRLESIGDPYSPEELDKIGTRARRLSAFVFSLILIGSIAINVYGMIHARNTVVTHYDVKIDKTVKNVKKLRVALISDLHLSYNSDVKMIENMVRKLNFYKPDVVFVTGDMFSSNYSSVRNPGEYIKAIQGIKAKEGVFWVYGNHDVEEPLFCGFGTGDPEDAVRTKKMKKFLKKSNFKILEDSRTAIAEGEVQLIGRADEQKPMDKAKKRLHADELLNDLDHKKPIIVLEHEPGDYKNLAANGADIAFSGHTHAGQVFPGTIVTAMLNDMVYGLETRNGMQVLVTSGVGNYGPPIRIGTNSEIVIADLNFK